MRRTMNGHEGSQRQDALYRRPDLTELQRD